MGRPSLPIAFALAILLLFFVASLPAPTFTGISYNSMDADVAFNYTINVTGQGTELVGGETVCRGPINIITNSTALYSNIQNAYVPCPTYGCGPRPSDPLSVPPFLLLFTNAARYNTEVATYFGTTFSVVALPANPLGPYNLSGTYYRIDPFGGRDVVGAATYSMGMFCYGTMQAFTNSTPQGSFNLNSLATLINYSDTANITFTPPAGSVSVFSNVSTGGCAVFVRTTETDGPTKDSVYTSMVSNSGQSGGVNITVVEGPNFTVVSPPGTFFALPSSPFNFSLLIRNIGDMNGTLLNITMTDGFTVTGFSPNQINVGQTVNLSINATAPAVIGSYAPNISMNYTSNTVALGSCGNGTAANLSMNGTVIIVGDNTPPVTTATAVNDDGSGYAFGSTTDQFVTVTLTCNDAGGIGCNSTYYCSSTSLTCAPNTVYSGPYKFSQFGTFYTCFYSDDLIGNNETVQCRQIVMVPPLGITVGLSVNPSGVLRDGGSYYPKSNVTINISIDRSSTPLGVTNTNLSIYSISPTGSETLIIRYWNGDEDQTKHLSWTDKPDIGVATNRYTSPPVTFLLTGRNPSVFRADASVYDARRAEMVRQSTYFVLYEMPCANRA